MVKDSTRKVFDVFCVAPDVSCVKDFYVVLEKLSGLREGDEKAPCRRLVFNYLKAKKAIEERVAAGESIFVVIQSVMKDKKYGVSMDHEFELLWFTVFGSKETGSCDCAQEDEVSETGSCDCAQEEKACQCEALCGEEEACQCEAPCGEEEACQCEAPCGEEEACQCEAPCKEDKVCEGEEAGKALVYPSYFNLSLEVARKYDFGFGDCMSFAWDWFLAAWCVLWRK